MLLTLPAWLSHACWLLSTAPRYIHDNNNNSTTCASRSVGRSVPSDFHVGECYCERQGRRGAKRKRWSCSRLDVEGNISRWGSVIENGERNDCISGLWLVVIKKTTTGFLSFCLPLSRAAGYSDYNIHSVWFNFMTLLIPQLICLWHYGFTVWPGY